MNGQRSAYEVSQLSPEAAATILTPRGLLQIIVQRALTHERALVAHSPYSLAFVTKIHVRPSLRRLMLMQYGSIQALMCT